MTFVQAFLMLFSQIDPSRHLCFPFLDEKQNDILRWIHCAVSLLCTPVVAEALWRLFDYSLQYFLLMCFFVSAPISYCIFSLLGALFVYIKYRKHFK